MNRAEANLKSLSEGNLAANESCGLWCSNNTALPEINRLFSILGIGPDGSLNAPITFRYEFHALVARILPLISDSVLEP